MVTAPSRIPELTRRELDVVEGIVHGYTNDEVAHSLRMSTNTVRSHLRTVYIKLGISNRIQLANWYHEND